MTATAGGASAVSRSVAERLLRRERRASLLVAGLAPIVLFVVLGIGWQGVAAAQPSILPPLGEVGGDLVAEPGFFAAQCWETLQSALLGLAVGVVVAFVLAVGAVHVRAVNAALLPLALLLVSTPIVAIAPALVVAFGFTRTPQVITVALCVFFPMFVNSARGLRSVDEQAMEVLRTLSATRWDTLVRLRLPSSLPYLFTGLRLSASGAMMGAVVAEFAAPSSGLGSTIILASSTVDLGRLWGAILLSALVTIALLAVVALVERAVVRW